MNGSEIAPNNSRSSVHRSKFPVESNSSKSVGSFGFLIDKKSNRSNGSSNLSRKMARVILEQDESNLSSSNQDESKGNSVKRFNDNNLHPSDIIMEESK